MTTYITQTRGLIGSSVLQKQSRLVRAARQQGILPFSLYYYPVDADSAGELSARQDGILSGVSFGDDIIVQLPTMLGDRYEQALLDKIANFQQASASKLVIAVTSLPTPSDLAQQVQFFNRADVLLVPSVEAGTFLQEHGLRVSRLAYLNVWDQKSDVVLTSPQFRRQLVTLDSSLADQTAGLWVRPSVTAAYDLNAAGGYALLWPSTNNDSGIAAAQVLASGLPVLVNRASYLARIVERAGMGIAFADLAAVTAYLARSNAEDYQALVENAGRLSAFVRAGGFTSHAISQAVADINRLK